MERDPQRATVHYLDSDKWDIINEFSIDPYAESKAKRNASNDVLQTLCEKKFDLRRGDIIRTRDINIADWMLIFDGEKLEDITYVPQTYTFPEFPIDYWSGIFKRDGFWVSEELIDHMVDHAYFGLPDDDIGIQYNYLCTSFIHDDVRYYVIYNVEMEDQRNIGLDNFKNTLRTSSLIRCDKRVIDIPDQCLINNNNVFYLLRDHTYHSSHAVPYDMILPDGQRVTRVS